MACKALPALLLALAGLAGGCSERAASVAAPKASVQAASTAQVVATVNGSPILAPDVAFQARSGKGAKQAVRELVQEELLVQEAARRGLDRDRRVTEVQRRAMVELFLRRTFHDQIGPAQIPMRLVEAAYRKNIMTFVRPETVEVAHLLCLAGKKQPPALHEAARRLADRVHELATARPLTVEQFLEIATRLKPEAGRVGIHGEKLTTPRKGFTVEPFAAAAFALAAPGAVSPVTQTSFGYHVVYLVRRIPAINRSLEEAQGEIRGRILDETRTQMLEEFLVKLEKDSRVQLMPENLPAGEATP